MLFNSYPPGVLVSPKLHPLGEAARISQFLASRVCQQQMFPAKGGYKTFVLFQSHFSGLPGDAAFGNTEHFSQLPVEGIVIVAPHDGKHITVPKDTGGISLMLDEPSQCPVHESTVSNLPVLAVLFTLVRQHTFMTRIHNFRPQCGQTRLRFCLLLFSLIAVYATFISSYSNFHRTE